MDVITIDKVVSNNLCTGCGTCKGICPSNAIEMRLDNKKGIYYPCINTILCNKCGLCYLCCPGEQVDFGKLRSSLFGKQPENKYLGNYISCYQGYSSNTKLRYQAASGGLITSILVYALESNLIDGAIVTKADEKSPLRPRSFISRTSDEIISAMGSSYCPVPVNTIIPEILNSKGHFAITGLPCHIHGLRKAEEINLQLKEKIVLHLGLVCNHTPTFRATDYLLRKHPKNRIVSHNYRGEGWPGKAVTKFDNNRECIIPMFDSGYWGYVFQNFFWPLRCLVCDDKLCELSDISFMDAWLPEIRQNDNIGCSFFITRSAFAEHIVNQTIDNNIIRACKTEGNKIIESQSLYLVKKNYSARRMLLKLFRYKVPSYPGHSEENKSIYELISNFYLFVLNTFIDRYVLLIDLFVILRKFRNTTCSGLNKIRLLFIRN